MDDPENFWFFDEERATRAVRFIEEYCVHTKGHSARKPFILAEWQREEIIRPLFGTVAYDDQQNEHVRQYRLAWIELARKNGKSELLAAIALLMLCADDEESAEVYSVAVDRDQASLVFNVAKRMVELSPKLSKILTVIDSRKRILHMSTNSVYAVLPGDAGGALGTNPSAVLFDEVLTQKDRNLWDAMRQGFGTRRQPLMVAATTASYSSAEFCLEEHEVSLRVADNPNLMPERFVYMRNTPRDADWRNEANWHHANPALGDFLNINALRGEAREAEENPSAQNAFRVFRLNQWVSQASRWFDMKVFDDSGQVNGAVVEEHLEGRRCYIGLDLSSTADMTAAVLVFPGTPQDETDPGFTVLPRFWIPRKSLERRKDMRERLEQWERDGFLTVFEGQTISQDAIETQLMADAERFSVVALAYDPWQSAQMVSHLEDHGMTCVKIPQSFARLNEPSKILEVSLVKRQLAHGGNPVLRWHADNVQTDVSPDGLIKPSKKNSKEKIDGIAGLVNALAVSMISGEPAPAVSFYSFT